jgi:hypothetical protein
MEVTERYHARNLFSTLSPTRDQALIGNITELVLAQLRLQISRWGIAASISRTVLMPGKLCPPAVCDKPPQLPQPNVLPLLRD